MAGSDQLVKPSYVTVVPTPTAAFSGTPTTGGPPPLLVNFTDQSAGNPTSWLWDFGDGNTSTEQNPTHTYGAAGVFDVSLTVTNPAGSNPLVQPGYITVFEPPTAAFTGTPTAAGPPRQS